MFRGSALLAAWWLSSLPVYAQDHSALQLEAGDLDFYLWQALQAATVEQRPALNHIGIQVASSPAGYRVSAVLEGYPAHAAEINRGDVIESVNGQPWHPVYSFNDPEAAPADFVADDAEYELKVRRGDDLFEVSVTPVFENLFDSYRSATVNSVQEFPAGNKVIGYLRLWSLSRNSNDLTVFGRILSELDHCDGLILDLRDAVGFLDTLHLDLIFPSRASYPEIEGDADWLRQSGAGLSTTAQNPFRKPIAVIINDATRGGPELYAYQLDKLQRVMTFGVTSAGRLGEFRFDHSAVKPSLRYQPAADGLIDGTALEAQGVTPGNPVPYPIEQSGRNDPQFQAAVTALMGII